jgi:hypothetical protein
VFIVQKAAPLTRKIPETSDRMREESTLMHAGVADRNPYDGIDAGKIDL